MDFNNTEDAFNYMRISIKQFEKVDMLIIDFNQSERNAMNLQKLSGIWKEK